MTELSSVEDSDIMKQNRWWVAIALMALFLPFHIAYFTGHLLLVFNVSGGWLILAGLTILHMLTVIASLIGVSHDRRTGAPSSEWTPSLVYYGLFLLPSLNTLFALVYLYQRHRHIGIP